MPYQINTSNPMLSWFLIFLGACVASVLPQSVGWAQVTEGCVAAYPDELFRSIRQSDSLQMWLSRHRDRTDLCVALAHCVWKIVDVPVSDLGTLSDFSGQTEKCGNSSTDIFWRGGSYRSNCIMPR